MILTTIDSSKKLHIKLKFEHNLGGLILQTIFNNTYLLLTQIILLLHSETPSWYCEN